MPLRGVKLLRSEILLRRVLDEFPFTFREAPVRQITIWAIGFNKLVVKL